MNYLAIDPSINNLGWTTYNTTNKEWKMGTVSPPKAELPERLAFIFAAIRARIDILPNVLICEFPQFENSVRGSAAAVQGYTFGLAAICGYLQGAFNVLPNLTFFYTPNQWKGQIPIDGIKYRFERKFGFKPKTEHEAHAAMLLDYHFNKLAK